MGLDTDAIEAVAFDSFSTLVDVESSKKALPDRIDDPERIATVWRRQALEYSMLANFLDEYETYYDCHRMGLEYAADLFGLDLTPVEIESINEVYYDLEPFDDVAPALADLVAAGYDPYVISNGDMAMLEAMVETLAVGDLLSAVVSADDIRTFKPHAKLYGYAAERAGVPVDRTVHVSAVTFDVQGAQNAGMQGVWLNREGRPAHPYGPEPNLEIDSLYALTDELDVD
ncbi:haloacid dehalogenase type II [Natrarchaeobius sp. A-rgal3]|uniref:haloacid dehalogenase type II n=1 Tax=Natrarchaeobius versutus TaxID=1679078 RepID=UPI00350EF9D0